MIGFATVALCRRISNLEKRFSIVNRIGTALRDSLEVGGWVVVGVEIMVVQYGLLTLSSTRPSFPSVCHGVRHLAGGMPIRGKASFILTSDPLLLCKTHSMSSISER